MNRGNMKLPVITPALREAEPDGMLPMQDVMEIFGYSSRRVVHVMIAQGKFPRPDAKSGNSVTSPSLWSCATIADEMMRRIERCRAAT